MVVEQQHRARRQAGHAGAQRGERGVVAVDVEVGEGDLLGQGSGQGVGEPAGMDDRPAQAEAVVRGLSSTARSHAVIAPR